MKQQKFYILIVFEHGIFGIRCTRTARVVLLRIPKQRFSGTAESQKHPVEKPVAQSNSQTSSWRAASNKRKCVGLVKAVCVLLKSHRETTPPPPPRHHPNCPRVPFMERIFVMLKDKISSEDTCAQVALTWLRVRTHTHTGTYTDAQVDTSHCDSRRSLCG